MRVEMLKKYSCIFRYDDIELSCCGHKRTCYLQIFPCWEVYSSGSLDHSDCSHLFCILCASVQQIMDLISDINMHITSAFNLKPALTKEIKRLPKVLTGVRNSVKCLSSAGLKATPTVSVTYSDCCSGSKNVEIRQTAKSSRNLNTDKFSTHRYSYLLHFHQHCNINSVSGKNYCSRLRCYYKGCNIFNFHGSCDSSQPITDVYIDSQGIIASKKGNTKRACFGCIPFLVVKTDLAMRSEIILFCQRDFTTNAADERSLILDSASRLEQVSQEHQDNASTNNEELPGDLQEKLQREQHVSYCDQDLTKDIILALRSVGDSLDARMTPGNEVFVHRARQVSSGLFLLMTLNHVSLFDLTIKLSLELLEQFSPL